MKTGVIIVIILMYLPCHVWGGYISGTAVSPSANPVNNTSIGTVAWGNLPGLLSAGSSYTSATATVLGQTTNYLMVTGFKFDLPSSAVIYGIKADIKKAYTGLLGKVTDNSIMIIKGGNVSGKSKATSSYWPASSTYTYYGDSTDVWNTSWSASDINSSSFGIAISARLGGVLALTSAQVYSVQLHVYYGLALPVNLVGFTAYLAGNNNTIDLNWATEQEINNQYFEVERSSDGINFEPISRVEGHGNTTVAEDYSTRDSLPMPGVNYYRLKQFDFNNQYQLSFIVSAMVPVGAGNIIIYPNPVQAGNTLQIKTTGNMEVKITDLSGKLYPVTVISQGNCMVNTGNLPNYILAMLRNELTDEVETRKIIVIH